MLHHLLRRLLWLVPALAVSSGAQAALDVCNDTAASHNVAIGYESEQGWISEGWWQVPADGCARVVSGDLPRRFYYLRVETEGWGFLDDKLGFCVDDKAFAIVDDDNCARRGYRQEEFARIDTGPDTPDFTYALSANLKRDFLNSAPSAASSQLRHIAVFQGCLREVDPYVSFCTFIGEGRRFVVYDDGRTPDALLQQMHSLPQGRSVALTGQREDVFDTTSELILSNIEVLPMDRFDRLLARLQGRWQSVDDPNDSFRVTGAERVNTYAGAETSVEYISIQTQCAGSKDEQGMYLFTWDRNAGTSLCYRIAQAPDEQLSLGYLPIGIQLTYRRES